ncbi:hypothetical protein K2X33_05770 [bacterium]|nr:hypothetical protein [bacterium]
MGLARSLVSYALTFSLLLSSFPAFGNDGPLGPRNIRLGNRQDGLYLAPEESKANPEAHNFSTTLQPLAPLSLEGIKQYLEERPELKGYRVVLIGPPVSGDQASKFKEYTEKVLAAAGVEAPVQIIRHPKTLKEKLLNLLPRREDYEKPIPSELKVAIWKILLAESLSFTVLLLPPVMQKYDLHITPEIDALAKQIAQPLGVGVAMCVLDIANMIPLISFRRALSNHNIRLNPTERFLRQLAMGMFFSFGFYAVSQSPQLYHYVGNLDVSQLPKDSLAAGWEMLKVIFPASVFNMLSRTTVGTSLNIWEQRSADRRFWTSVMEAVAGLVIAPVYILSTMPVLQPVVQTPIMDLNAAHLTMLGIGTVGAAAWAKLEWEGLARWFTGLKNSCARWLGFKGTKTETTSEDDPTSPVE